MLTLLAVIQSAAFFLAAAEPLHPPLPTPSLSAPPPVPSPITWEQFCLQFGKRYASLAEEHYRRHVFLHAVRQMQQHNANPARTYSMKVNPLFDVDSFEFQEVYTRTFYERRDGQEGGRQIGGEERSVRLRGGKNYTHKHE